MRLTWKKRIQRQSEYQDLNNWPYVEPALLPIGKRRQYIRNRKIAAKALKGITLRKIAQEYDLSISTISYMLNRALGGDVNQIPELTSALIPGGLIKPGRRKLPLSQCDNQSGARGSFQALLRTVPGLNRHLEEMLVSFVQKKSYSQNLTPQIFHKEFLRLLHDANWPETTYPFDRDNLAYETCRRYFHKRLCELTVQPNKVSRTILSINTPMIAYEEIQVDAQITDINSSVYLEINGIFHSLRLSRLSLYLVKDVATDCNLAYQLCFTKDPNQADLLEALGGIHRPWTRLALKTPGLTYSEGACLPTAAIDDSPHIGVNLVRLDNALCHLADSVRDYICHKLHATLNFGLPGQPKGRNYIEHGIHLIGKNNHRFASTTGSHPRSPIKETKANSKTPPKITLQALEEILSVLITHHNIQPQERLGGASPIQLLKEHVAHHFIPYSFSSLTSPLNSSIRQTACNVKLIKGENRRPHINFCYLRYTGNCLSAKLALEKEVIIEFDETDIRTLTVLSFNGKHLGTVHAPRSWQSHPHSTRTRKRIMNITKRLRLLGHDPLAGYFSYLLANKELPKVATELVRVTREFGNCKLTINDDTVSERRLSDDGKTLNVPLRRELKAIPDWSPTLQHVPKKDVRNDKV